MPSKSASSAGGSKMIAALEAAKNTPLICWTPEWHASGQNSELAKQPKTAGRPRKYVTDAERQKAYRARQSAARAKKLMDRRLCSCHLTLWRDYERGKKIDEFPCASGKMLVSHETHLYMNNPSSYRADRIAYIRNTDPKRFHELHWFDCSAELIDEIFPKQEQRGVLDPPKAYKASAITLYMWRELTQEEQLREGGTQGDISSGKSESSTEPAKKIPGSTPKTIPGRGILPEPFKNIGRPRQYATDAERQKAYRDRQMPAKKNQQRMKARERKRKWTESQKVASSGFNE